MSIGGYKIRNKEEIHFITFAVVEWVDVFTRKQYRDIVIDSLKRCQRNARYFLIPPCFACYHVFLFHQFFVKRNAQTGFAVKLQVTILQ